MFLEKIVRSKEWGLIFKEEEESFNQIENVFFYISFAFLLEEDYLSEDNFSPKVYKGLKPIFKKDIAIEIFQKELGGKKNFINPFLDTTIILDFLFSFLLEEGYVKEVNKVRFFFFSKVSFKLTNKAKRKISKFNLFIED